MTCPLAISERHDKREGGCGPLHRLDRKPQGQLELMVVAVVKLTYGANLITPEFSSPLNRPFLQRATDALPPKGFGDAERQHLGFGQRLAVQLKLGGVAVMRPDLPVDEHKETDQLVGSLRH